MKGFRDSGRSGGALDAWLKVMFIGDGRLLAGEAARLRNGLLEGRFAVKPGDGSLRESVKEDKLMAEGRRAGCLGERFRRRMSNPRTLTFETQIVSLFSIIWDTVRQIGVQDVAEVARVHPRALISLPNAK